jgi:membrane protease subunit HflC
MLQRVLPISILGLLVLALFTCTYTLKEWEQGLVLQFGKYKRVENAWNDGAPAEAGLKFKLPWENVLRLERRNIEIDFNAETIYDMNQKPLEVDSFILYRIVDPVAYYKDLNNKRRATQVLDELLDSSLRGVLARVDSEQIISGRRAELMSEIQQSSNLVARQKGYGVEITDVRIKKAELPTKVADSVFQRMNSEREKIARLRRAEGEKQKNEIIADADKQATVTLATARGKGQTIRGEGDAISNKIYNDAYGLDPEFFAFYRSMEAYRRGLGEGTTYVLSPDSDFLSYLDNQRGSRRR